MLGGASEVGIEILGGRVVSRARLRTGRKESDDTRQYNSVKEVALEFGPRCGGYALCFHVATLWARSLHRDTGSFREIE